MGYNVEDDHGVVVVNPPGGAREWHLVMGQTTGPAQAHTVPDCVLTTDVMSLLQHAAVTDHRANAMGAAEDSLGSLFQSTSVVPPNAKTWWNARSGTGQANFAKWLCDTSDVRYPAALDTL